MRRLMGGPVEPAVFAFRHLILPWLLAQRCLCQCAARVFSHVDANATGGKYAAAKARALCRLAAWELSAERILTHRRGSLRLFFIGHALDTGFDLVAKPLILLARPRGFEPLLPP